MSIQRIGDSIRQEKNFILLQIAAVLLVVSVSGFKYKSGEINYYNSDATWHTLLTIESYNETPISEHLFLPIVSLGDTDDKYIPWGATVLGNDGNYYYTSFSPAGYFLPWLFMKIFGLSVTEQGLYVFNTVLFILSTVLWTWFVYIVFKKKKCVPAIVISMIGMFTYIFSSEIFHGMGMVYWHQSLMQVTLLIQIIAYYNTLEYGGKSAKAIFYLMALVNPYIEWTGYVANVGFALTEMIVYKKRGLGKACIIGVVTAASFVIFSVHYLLRINVHTFFEALKFRFMARNVATDVSLTDVFGGYFKSFMYLWLLLLCLMIWNIVKNKRIEIEHGILLLVLVFPVLENVIMKEHAITYTYDRMKFIFFLSFLICELSYGLLKSALHDKINIIVGVLAGTIIVCGLNLKVYKENSSYVWEIDYRKDNQIIADYINENYSNSVLAINGWGIRGYMNLLFGRGIYEGLAPEQLKQIAVSRGKQYAITIHFADEWSEYNRDWGLYKIISADVYDIYTGDIYQISIPMIKALN